MARGRQLVRRRRLEHFEAVLISEDHHREPDAETVLGLSDRLDRVAVGWHPEQVPGAGRRREDLVARTEKRQQSLNIRRILRRRNDIPDTFWPPDPTTPQQHQINA